MNWWRYIHSRVLNLSRNKLKSSSFSYVGPRFTRRSRRFSIVRAIGFAAHPITRSSPGTRSTYRPRSSQSNRRRVPRGELQKSLLRSLKPVSSQAKSVLTFVCPDLPSDVLQVAWYGVRTRLSTIYGFAESHLLSPAHPAHLSSADRLELTYEVVDRLLDRTRQLKDSVDGASAFVQWVGKSWAGMGRSLGL